MQYLYKYHSQIGVIIIGFGFIYLVIYGQKYIRHNSEFDWKDKLYIYGALAVIILGFVMRLFGGFIKYI